MQLGQQFAAGYVGLLRGSCIDPLGLSARLDGFLPTDGGAVALPLAAARCTQRLVDETLTGKRSATVPRLAPAATAPATRAA